ncbi:hypothetical protein DASB73_019530 [Starmerella bacillaris]|uniref:Uncharacterized protein n=1 Tax=Starmerella bacillaris TaxID=1247836 RepID=A0AAV5RHJ4_STABA|nr:hypothetical protein DASB73_019530 [Starmerella bacillaris]
MTRSGKRRASSSAHPSKRPAKQPQLSLFGRIKSFLFGSQQPEPESESESELESADRSINSTNPSLTTDHAAFSTPQIKTKIQRQIQERRFSSSNNNDLAMESSRIVDESATDLFPPSKIGLEDPSNADLQFPSLDGPNETLRQFFESKGDEELSNMEIVGVLSLIGQAVGRNESLVDFSRLSELQTPNISQFEFSEILKNDISQSDQSQIPMPANDSNFSLLPSPEKSTRPWIVPRNSRGFTRNSRQANQSVSDRSISMHSFSHNLNATSSRQFSSFSNRSLRPVLDPQSRVLNESTAGSDSASASASVILKSLQNSNHERSSNSIKRLNSAEKNVLQNSDDKQIGSQDYKLKDVESPALAQANAGTASTAFSSSFSNSKSTEKLPTNNKFSLVEPVADNLTKNTPKPAFSSTLATVNPLKSTDASSDKPIADVAVKAVEVKITAEPSTTLGSAEEVSKPFSISSRYTFEDVPITVSAKPQLQKQEQDRVEASKQKYVF